MRPTRLIVCLCLVFAACHKHVPITALPPTPAPAPVRAIVPPPEPAPPEPTPVAPPPDVSPLNAPDHAFTAGKYDEAARGYEDYLRANPAGAQRDQALFYFGLSLTVRPNPSPDFWTRATAAFKELVDQHSESPFRQPASLILSLHSDLDQLTADIKLRDQRIKQLSTELERLKKIDERRK
jgi:hypothetical protein